MTVGQHYLLEANAKIIVTIPIATALIDDWLEAVLTMIDDRINQRCWLSTNTTNAIDKAALTTVEFNSMLKLVQNMRLTKEGVPAEISFVDSWFSAEDKFIMQDIRSKSKYVAKGYARDAEV